MKKNVKKNDKWRYISFGLICFLVFIFLFSSMQSNKLKQEIKNKSELVEDLTEKNAKLSENIKELNTNLEASLSNTEGEKISEQFTDVSNKFIELYPMFNIKTIEDKKNALNKIATKSVSDSIVPDDLIKSSKQTLDPKNTETKTEVYSTDPTFVSTYKDSKVYVNFINANSVEYFAIVNYDSKSSSGESEMTTYIQFEVTKDGGTPLVTNYDIKYIEN